MCNYACVRAEAAERRVKRHLPNSKPIGRLFFRRSDGVFCSLCDAELDHGLGLDLDGFAGLRVATKACLAICLNQFADAGDGELAVFLCFLDGCLCQQIEEGCGLLVGQFDLFCQYADERCFCQSFCHVCCSLVTDYCGSRFCVIANYYSEVRGDFLLAASCQTDPRRTGY